MLGLDAAGRHPLVFALAMCGGAAWYVVRVGEPDLWGLIGAFGLALAGLLLVRRVSVLPPICLGVMTVLFGLACGALSGKLATLRVSHPVLTEQLGPVMIEGWVEDVEPAKRGVRLRLIVHAVDGLAGAALPREVRVTHLTRLAVESGRFVRCWAVLRPPPGPIVEGDYAFNRQAYFEGLGAVGYVQGRCRGGTLGAPVSSIERTRLWVAKQRRALAHFIYEAAGPRAGGFAAALSSGDRSFMAQADQEALRGSGLAHLLAISGLHMGIVGGLVFLMVWRALALIEPVALRIPVQKPAAICALSASLVYLVLSGASVSTQRAFIMTAILFGAVLFNRTALSLRSLAIAMIVVVLLAPWSVLTPGFQMSFAATAALIATYEAWQRGRRAAGLHGSAGVSFWLKSLFVTSLVSSLATLPFALFHFDRFAALGLMANLLAMPIISLVSAPLAGASLVLSVFGLSEYPLRLFGYSLEAVLWISHMFSDAAPDHIGGGRPMPGAALACLTAGFVAAIMLSGWRKRLAGVALFAALAAAIWMSVPAVSVHWAPSGDVFIVDGNRTIKRIEAIKADGLGPLRFADVPVSGRCDTEACWHDVGSLQLVIVPPLAQLACETSPTPDLVLQFADADVSQGCAGTVARWSDTLASSGQSWRIEQGVFRARPKPPCNSRPWQPCLRQIPP